MADVFDTQVKLAFVIPQAEVDKIKKVASTALAFSGGRASSVGALASMGGKLGGAGAVAGMLTVASPSLSNSINRVVNAVMMIIRPIGDILAVGLRPIIDLLKPVGLFFRILLKPYIQKAMEAMRLGRGFLAKGKTEEAAKAYALGIGYILKPFYDLATTISTSLLQGMTWIIKQLGIGLLSIIPGASDEKIQKFSDNMDKLVQNIGLTGAKMILDSTVSMEKMLTELKVKWEEVKNMANVSMASVNVIVGEGFVNMINSVTNFFAPSLKFETDRMFDEIVNYAREKVNELNTILGKTTTTTSTTTTSHQITRADEYLEFLRRRESQIIAGIITPGRESGGGGSSGAG